MLLLFVRENYLQQEDVTVLLQEPEEQSRVLLALRRTLKS